MAEMIRGWLAFVPAAIGFAATPLFGASARKNDWPMIFWSSDACPGLEGACGMIPVGMLLPLFAGLLLTSILIARIGEREVETR